MAAFFSSAPILANRKHTDLKQFVVPRKEDLSKSKDEMESEALKDYLKYLAPSFELPGDEDREAHVRTPKHGSRLTVQRRNGNWELVLAAHRHETPKKEQVLKRLRRFARNQRRARTSCRFPAF